MGGCGGKVCVFAKAVESCDECMVILRGMVHRGCTGATVHRLNNLACFLRLDCADGHAENYKRHLREFLNLLK